MPSQGQTSSSTQYSNNVDDAFSACYNATAFHSLLENQSTSKSQKWIIDSGCTAHLCGDEKMFDSISMSSGSKIKLACHTTSDVKGKGSVIFPVSYEDDLRYVKLQNTLYVPDLRTNLVSVAKITDQGHIVTFKKEYATVTDQKGNEVFIAERKADLYYAKNNFDQVNIAEVNNDARLWHKQLGHLNVKGMAKIMEKTIGAQLSDEEKNDISLCDICIRGKMTALPFSKGGTRSSQLLNIVHSDVVGPMRTQSSNGARWFVTFIDDCSRWCEVYFFKQKSGVYEAFKAYKSFAEKQTGSKIKCLQSDNGREYCNEQFDTFLSSQGIERRLTVARTPQQNGVAERMNRTLVDMARCLMLQASIEQTFWSDAIATACHIRNRCPSSAINWNSPYEKWGGKISNIKYLKTFGAHVYVLNKDPTKGKFAERTMTGIFVGYPRETKGYRVWLPEERKFKIARDVKFHESKCDDVKTGNQKVCMDNVDNNDSMIQISPVNIKTPELSPKAELDDTPRSSKPSESEYENEGRRGRGRPKLIRTGNPGRPRKLFKSAPEIAVEEIDLPNDEGDDDVFAGVAEISVNDALSSLEHEEWEKAIMSEVESLISNNTLKIVKKQNGQNLVGSRVVLTNKYNINGEIEKRKARIVAKGYSQRLGVDYNQTFAPVARLDSVRILLALSAQYGMKIKQLDVVTAYLNGKLDEKVYMEIPDVFTQMLKLIVRRSESSYVKRQANKMLIQINQGGDACLLQKALYGLRQAGQKWHQTLSQKLVEMGLKPTQNEPCMYHARRNGSLLVLIVYVDDILIASKDTNWIDEISSNLAKSFAIKDLGLAKRCLGLEITQSDQEIAVTQTGYINDILNKYGMKQCNPIKTPAEINSNKRKVDPMKKFDTNMNCDGRKYRELIGLLMYLAVGTRPDISNTVSRLAQFVSGPKEENFKAAKRVLRYLAGTQTLGLKYSRSEFGLVGYSDADWGGCHDRRSYTGYVFLIANGAITWKSQKQCTVATSSTEAEYVSLAEATKEVLYLRSLLQELKLNEIVNIVLYVDNRGAQCLANHSVYHSRTKHIDIKHHFVRDAIRKGLIVLQHVPTDQMVADILTQPLTREPHWKCVYLMGESEIM